MADLGDDVGGLAKASAPPHGIGFSEVILDQTQADIITHLVELLVNLDIVALVILRQLGDDGSVGQGDELGVHLVDAASL